MKSQRSVALMLSGTVQDEHLTRYATMVAGLGRAVDPVDAEFAAPRGARALGVETETVAAEKRRIVVISPDSLRLVPPAEKADRALQIAAEEGIEVVLLGEDAGGTDPRRLARRLIRESPSSVWFVPQGAGDNFRRLLVPVDFSTRSADSLRVATSLGHLAATAECLALHIYFNDLLIQVPGQDRRLLERLADTHARFMAGIDPLGVKVIPRFREAASVGRAIARAAEEEAADLIVMASRGRTTAGALVLESVAEQTLCETRIPLLVVKHFGGQLGLLAALREKLFYRNDELRFN